MFQKTCFPKRITIHLQHPVWAFRPKWYFLLVLLCSLATTPLLRGQGCMPARHIPPNVGTNGQSFLAPGEWEVGLSYRYLYSNTFFIGTEEQVEYKETGQNALYHHHTFNLSARYAVNERFSLTLNVPVMYAKESDIHYDGMRHFQNMGTQLGDVRVVGNYWLYNPLAERKGNIAVGLGVKLPTGNEELEGTFYNFDGRPTIRDYDIALQAGDGGFGIITSINWFHWFGEQFSWSAEAHYIITPQNTNNSVPQWFEPSAPYRSSIPDQFNLQTGFTYAIGQFGISAGLRLDGMPLNDLIGKSDGFRRPGEILYFDNALMWSNITNTIRFSFPYALHRNLRTSNLDQSLGIKTLGGLADFLVTASYVRRF